MWMFLLLVAVGASGCVTYTPPESAVLASANIERRLEQINGRYIVGAGDQVQLLVRNGPGLSGSHRVAPDGYITLELVGDLYIEGMTSPQIGDVIEGALKNYIRDVDVTCRVTAFNSKQYYLYGETSPGSRPYTGDVTVLKALGDNRFVTRRAAWDRVRLIRATPTTRQIFHVHLRDIVIRGQWETNFQLKADDVLYVPPTILARIGYFVDNILFPFRSIFQTVYTYNNTFVPQQNN
jgi:polysaccharide export outer membrane protein